MKVLSFLGLTLALVLPQAAPPPKPAGCDALGNVQFICGVISAEDLVVVPNSDWVVASGDAAGGAVTLINVRDKTTTALFPGPGAKQRLDAKTYDSCPGPLQEPRDQFRAHGLYLHAGRNAQHTLYVVHHGSRESIEVFELDGRGKPPALTWIGCAVAPNPIGLNSVVALPEGGFASTNFQPRGVARGQGPNMQAGERNGELWEWHTGTGWKIVPGSEASGANGIEISKDGKWFYMGGWGNQTFIRMSRGQTPMKRDDIPVGFRLDNLRWAPDGSLLASGQEPTAGALAMVTSRVIKIDPKTLAIKDVLRYPFNDVFGFSTVAIQVGKEIWVGIGPRRSCRAFPGTVTALVLACMSAGRSRRIESRTARHRLNASRVTSVGFPGGLMSTTSTARVKWFVLALTIVLVSALSFHVRMKAADAPLLTIATGLDNPRGLAFGPDGALYVVEAGRGGNSSLCLPDPVVPGGTRCYGPSGALTKVTGVGVQQRVLTGLPSLAGTSGGSAIGPIRVDFAAGNAWITIGFGGTPATRAQLAAAGINFGTLIRVPPDGQWVYEVDISAYEAAINPDGGAIDSNPYGLKLLPGRALVTDAGANALLNIDTNRAISTLAVFPNRTVPGPFGVGTVPMQAVPTCVTVGPDGNIYVGELTGFPFPVGLAQVYRVPPQGGTPVVVGSGFTNIIDLAIDRDGTAYVLKYDIDGNFAPAGPSDAGRLTRVTRDGVRTIITSALTHPGGVAIGPDGALYVTNRSIQAGLGEVIRVVP